MPSGSTTALAEDEAAAIRLQTRKILTSSRFIRAERLSRFLNFVIEKAIEGRGAEVKESVIGLEVFGRPISTYDPSVDPIVRVQAGRLRTKLAEYYEQEGAGDSVVIELPRGGYVPSFRVHSTSPPRAYANTIQKLRTDTRSVAVLPFVNLSADQDNDYFSDGLTEELIHSLAGIPSIRVAARSSVFQFKAGKRDVREIGRLLGVGKIIEGSVRKAGDRFRIVVQLVNVEDGYQVWSQRYEGTGDDLFALQDDIAGGVRGAIASQLSAPGARVYPTTSIQAYRHYLKGRFHWNKRNERGLHSAIEHFQEAIAIDPDYGRAYSGFADCQFMLGISAAETPRACMPAAEQAALQALKADSHLVEAHTSLAAIKSVYDWHQRSEGEREFQIAFDLDPNYPTLHQWRSLFSLAPRGRLDEAIEDSEWAEELDPISLPIINSRALVLTLSGRHDEAIKQCNKVISLDPGYYRTYWFMGLAYERLGKLAEATSALQTALAGTDADGGKAFRSRIQGALGRTLARSGMRERAHAILGEMEASSQNRYVDQFELAQIELGLNELDKAVMRLERAVEDHSTYLIYCKVWPGFESLQDHPRFQELLSRLLL